MRSNEVSFVVSMIFLFSFILVPSHQPAAYGLSCAQPNMTNSFEYAEIIFSGVATSSEHVGIPNDRTGKSVTQFSISEHFKGIYENVVNVYSDQTWGPYFQKSLEYLVFADKIDNKIKANSCSSTDLLENIDLELVRNLSGGYFLPPLQQIKIGIISADVVCKHDMELIFKVSDNSPACVKPESITKLIERGWAQENKIIHLDSEKKSFFKVPKDDMIFDVEYEITGGTVQDMVFLKNANALTITIDSSENGNLSMSLPRNLVDAKLDYCPPRHDNSPDDLFFVIVDGKEINYEEIETTSEMRTLQISFLKDSVRIEIIGTCFV